MTDLNQLHNLHTSNMKKFPALYGELSRLLNVSVTSLAIAEAGFCPSDEFGNQAWTFPERDEKGNVTGLSVRTNSGKKYMVPESKHGLFYGVNYGKTEEYEKTHWERVSKEYPCSLCGKADGCMYPHGEYGKPNAIACVHISEGSSRPMEIGYLHILDKERQARYRAGTHSILLPSSNPILVVEGASDVCAAFDLGFTAVGRPSAQGGRDTLAKMLSGRKTIIIGENDSGVGRTGMETTFATLQPVCSSCIKVLPPEGVKDLRQWRETGLTQKELLDYIKKAGQTTLSENVFEDDIPDTITLSWLRDQFTINGKLCLRLVNDQFINFNGNVYEPVDKIFVRGDLYRYLRKKSFVDLSNNAIKRYKPSKSKINDILDACSDRCPLLIDLPGWLTGGKHPNPRRLITFQNGLLDLDDYINGKITLHNPTPDYCTLSALPYNFDENAESQLWDDSLEEIFNGDGDKIALLSQWFGYVCVPDNSWEKFMLLKGPTRSGKGTILDALEATIGHKNCCGTSFQSLAGQFATQPLLGKLSATMGDARNTTKDEMNKALALILAITGKGSLSVNKKNIAEVPYSKLYCRFTVAMNDLPAFTDHSRSFENRVMILTFPNSYVNREDHTLKDRLAQEAASGKLINFALRGLKSLYCNGDFVAPSDASSILTMRALREFVSPIVPFVESCIEYDAKDGVPVDYLYEMWKWWCAREGRNAGLKSTFIRNLLSTANNAIQIREGEADNPSRVIMGIKVSEWGQKEYLKGV